MRCSAQAVILSIDRGRGGGDLGELIQQLLALVQQAVAKASDLGFADKVGLWNARQARVCEVDSTGDLAALREVCAEISSDSVAARDGR